MSFLPVCFLFWGPSALFYLTSREGWGLEARKYFCCFEKKLYHSSSRVCNLREVWRWVHRGFLSYIRE